MNTVAASPQILSHLALIFGMQCHERQLGTGGGRIASWWGDERQRTLCIVTTGHEVTTDHVVIIIAARIREGQQIS